MHVRPIVTPAVVAALVVSLCACNNDARKAPATAESAGSSTQPASARPTTFTGTLQGGVAAVGGETTGWRLVGDGQAGGLDLDVSKAGDRAKSLDGKRVTVTGKMTTRSWPERGATPVLVAEKIEPAETPKP